MQGYFPKNYVKEKTLAVPAAPKPPPRPARPVSTLPPPSRDPSSEEVGKVTEVLANLSTQEPRKVSMRAAKAFSLKSLIAFDDLMQKGYAVEIIPTEIRPGRFPQKNELVELQCEACTWDGAMGETSQYASGVLKFIIGRQQVVPGLEAAVKVIPIGHSATVTCAPSLAYGTAGFPPVVPANSFVVFHVTLLAASAVQDLNMAPEGPSTLFVANLPSQRQAAASTARRDSRILLASTADAREGQEA